jgi:hypothetical protein
MTGAAGDLDVGAKGVPARERMEDRLVSRSLPYDGRLDERVTKEHKNVHQKLARAAFSRPLASAGGRRAFRGYMPILSGASPTQRLFVSRSHSRLRSRRCLAKAQVRPQPRARLSESMHLRGEPRVSLFLGLAQMRARHVRGVSPGLTPLPFRPTHPP